MSKAEITEAAAAIAQKLGGYPMLVTLLLLIAYIVYDHWSDKRITGQVLKEVVYEERAFLRKELAARTQELHNCRLRLREELRSGKP